VPYTLVISDPPNTFSPDTLPGGTVGVEYSQTLSLSPARAVGWGLAYGALPNGLTLTPQNPYQRLAETATITGIPVLSGSFRPTIYADLASPSGGPRLMHEYGIPISLPTFSFVGSTLPYGVVGAAYNQNLTASGGYGSGTHTFTQTAGTLPPGLALAANGGLLGTPTAKGTYSFTVVATSKFADYQLIGATATFSVNIVSAALTLDNSGVPAGTVGATYAQRLAAAGGIPPYSWQVTSGSLPGGLALDQTGVLHGTPSAAGSFTFQVTVRDSQNGSVAATFTIRIAAAALVITTASLPNGKVGDPYTATLAATVGTPPYSWQVTSGSLPAGLTLDPTGTLHGTPWAAGSFTFQVTVRDSQQSSGAATFTIRIAAAALVITTASLPNGNVGDPYTATLAATGGTPPYTWSVASGALPNGLSIDSAGLISGTPATAGTPSVILQVTDSAQATATKAYSVNVTLTTTGPLPTVNGVTNAASYATGAVSPGELVTIFGTNIGPVTAASATTDLATGKLATAIGGVQMLFNGIAAPMIYASSTQVSAVVPYEMAPVANPSVWIKYSGQTSNADQLTTAATAPGLFTQNAAGSGPGAILNQDNSVNGPGNRAAKGSIVQVYMTGEGLSSPPSVTGAITAASLPPPQVTPAPLLAVGVTINGQPASYVYAGEAPGLVAGMMQLNVQIPANAPSGELPILVSVGGNTSQKGVTVSVQ
jgi:uncharacterized protein (TIGR03437 family)